MPGANVQSEALQEMRAAMVRFGADLKEALDSAETGLRVKEEWITERVRAWQYQVRRWTDEVEEAQRAVRSCEADTDDEGNGRDCSAEYAAFAHARRQLANAEEQFAIAQRWMQAIASAAGEYRREAMRMRQSAEQSVDKGSAYLSARIAELDGYRAVPLASVGSDGQRYSVLMPDSPTLHPERWEAHHTLEIRDEEAQLASRLADAEQRYERAIHRSTAGGGNDPIENLAGAIDDFLSDINANRE